MSLNVNKRVVECLKENLNKKLEASEIAEWIINTYPDECRAKQEKSRATVIPLDSHKALRQQIAAEIGAKRAIIQKKNSEIKTTEGRPRKYYFSDSIDIAEEANEERAVKEDAKVTQNDTAIKEEQLYTMLSDFLLSEFEIYSDRIDEKRSPNNKGRKGNQWLHPDVVGIEVLNTDWSVEIKECVKEHADKISKLWSFEVKVIINRSNIREYFFQTVSNSSWANFGYLVASEIEGAETMKEMNMLCSLHGIGFIKLNTENPSESQILIPATERNEIDWNVANRLSENEDFKSYIKKVAEFYKIREIKPHEWHKTSSQ